jgi:hypothetical protein
MISNSHWREMTFFALWVYLWCFVVDEISAVMVVFVTSLMTIIMCLTVFAFHGNAITYSSSSSSLSFRLHSFSSFWNQTLPQNPLAVFPPGRMTVDAKSKQ